MPRIDAYKRSFGIVARDYKKYRGSYNPALFAYLLSLIKAHKNQTLSVLDLGCGVGNSTEPLLRAARKSKISLSITGCDPDPRMLKEARASQKKAGLPITYVVGRAEKLPFQKEQFDLVISGAAFHWFATQKAMKQVQRVLKKGGTYAVFWTQNIPGKNVVIGQGLYKKYHWKGIPRGLRDPKNVKTIFAKTGFSKIKTAKIPYPKKRTMEETIGLMKTNSSYALLSPEDKKIFTAEMKKDYMRALGRRADLIHQVINVCSGRK